MLERETKIIKSPGKKKIKKARNNQTPITFETEFGPMTGTVKGCIDKDKNKGKCFFLTLTLNLSKEDTALWGKDFRLYFVKVYLSEGGGIIKPHTPREGGLVLLICIRNEGCFWCPFSKTSNFSMLDIL